MILVIGRRNAKILPENPAKIGRVGITDCGCDFIDKNNQAKGAPVTGSGLNAKCLNWIFDQLKTAQEQNIMVIGMMHHGLIPILVWKRLCLVTMSLMTGIHPHRIIT